MTIIKITYGLNAIKDGYRIKNVIISSGLGNSTRVILWTLVLI